MAPLELPILTGLGHWQIDLLAFGLLLEGCLFTVFPEEVIFISLGIACGAGQVGFLEAVLFAQAGVVSANAISVWLGGRLGWALCERRPFSLLFRGGAIQRAMQLLRTSVPGVIFLTRFTPLIRGPIYIAAGIAQVSWKRTLPIDFLASCLQVPTLVYLGKSLTDPVGALTWLLRAGVGIGGAGLAVIILSSFKTRTPEPGGAPG